MSHTKTARQIAAYEKSNPKDQTELEARRNRLLDHRGMVIAGLGATIAGITLMITPQGRSDVLRAINPNADQGNNPARLELAKDHEHILSLTKDSGHPGLDTVIYKYGPNQTGSSAIAAEVAPGERDAGKVEADLKTYPSYETVIQTGDTITFDIDDATGDVVPNPDN